MSSAGSISHSTGPTTFTREALHAISETTIDNISAFEQGRRSGNELY
jgi:hypothetical protein